MKKLITLTFALFFCAGVAFGQGVVDVDQSGNNNTATATQNLADDANLPIKISIDQAGNNNTATSTQNAGSYSGVYLSTIDQSGNGNGATQTVKSSLGINALIDQSGNYNDADQSLHFGIDDRANTPNDLPANPSFSITQSGGYNVATQTVGKEGQLDANLFAEIIQSGSDNTATQVMSGDDHWFNILQSGSGNVATMKVNDYWGAHDGDGRADITQSGDDNIAKAFMHASNRYNVDIMQPGSENFAKVVVKGGLGALNTVSVTQKGVNSDAYVTVTGNGNTATVVQK